MFFLSNASEINLTHISEEKEQLNCLLIISRIDSAYLPEIESDIMCMVLSFGNYAVGILFCQMRKL